jgi:hypothetical protein
VEKILETNPYIWLSSFLQMEASPESCVLYWKEIIAGN